LQPEHRTDFFYGDEEENGNKPVSSLTMRRALGRVFGVYVVTRVAIICAAMYGARVSTIGGLGNLFRGWDGQHYLAVAKYGYPRHSDIAHFSRIAFFPLYPLVVRILSHLTHLSYLGVGEFVSLAAGAGFVIVATRLVALHFGVEAAERAGIVLCVFPGSLALSLPYAEALALLLAALAIMAMESDRPYRAGVISGLATAASPLMLGLVPVMAWRAWRSREHGAWVTTFMTPLGFIGFMNYLRIHTGHLNDWFAEERQSYSHRMDLFAPIQWLSHWSPAGFTEVICIVVLAWAMTCFVRARVPISWWLYSLSIVVVTMFDGGLYLTPRILLNAFPLVLAIGVVASRRAFVTIAFSFALLLPIIFLAYMTIGTTTGPP
jgi:hypothetical protein